MRKLTATTAAAVLLTAGLTTPAWAAAPAAPTDVQVSWIGTKIRVTWQDNGEANQVAVVFPDTGRAVAQPSADAPNQVDLGTGAFAHAAKVRVSVRSVGADNELSAAAHSPLFDTHGASKPALWGATSLSTTSVRLLWNQDTIADETPNDPLDQPAGEWLKATVRPAEGQRTESLIPGGAKYADVPVPAGSVTIDLSAGNEWGLTPARDFQTVRVGTMRVSASFPAQARWAGFSVNGKLQMSEPPAGEYLNFDVQARPNSSAPWRKVSTGSGAARPGTVIPAWTGSAGGRDYRLWAAATESLRDDVFLVTPPASTSSKFVRKNAYITAGFAPNTARVSATVQLKVGVIPSLPLKAALHNWDGKQWRYLRAVQLDSKGKASIPIRAAGRGTTTKYRIATPPVKVNGLPVDASTSTPFTLKVV